MGTSEGSNIFEEARKSLGGKPKPKLFEKKPLSASVPASEGKSLEVGDMLRRLREMDADLKARVDRICQLSGMTRGELDTFIENPQNFHAEQWTKVQEEKEALEGKMYQALGFRAKKTLLKKKKLLMSKERKGKTLGARKGWMQM